MRKIILALLLPLLLLIIVPTSFAAENLKGQKIVTVAKDEVVDGNFYGAGEIVEIMGTVNGDVYVAGGQVTIDGIINGDLLAAGGMLNITGVVNGDVRAAGGQVNVNAQVERNLTLAGGNVDVTNTSSVGKALQILGGNLIVSAPVSEEILVAGGNLTYRGTTGKNLEAKVGTLRLAPGSKIAGNFDYWASEEPLVDEGAVIGGTTTKHDLPDNLKNYQSPSPESIKNVLAGISLFAKITSIITTLVFGLILIKLFPNCARSATEVVKTRSLASFGLGLLATILTPIIFIIMLVTGVGIPLALITFALFLIFVFFSKTYVILALGQILNKKISKNVSPMISLTIGIITYYALSYIPIISGLTQLIAFTIGTGAGLLSAKALYHEAREKKIF